MQFLELKTHFVFKDHKKLAEMFKTETIINYNLMPSADGFNFYKTIHSHHTESQTINFTCIYVPQIDEIMTVFSNYLGMSMYMSIADYTRFKRIRFKKEALRALAEYGANPYDI